MPVMPSAPPHAPPSTLPGGLKLTRESMGDQVAAGAPAQKPVRKLTNMSILELLLMFDEARKVIATVVGQLIGAKATHSMLTKSFEKARTRFQKVYRNANWKSDGSLREDGSLDKERVMRNITELPEPKRAEELIAALADLLAVRLTAIEQGLARKVAAAVICDITEQLERTAMSGRYEKGNLALFVEEILPPVSLG